MAISVVHGEPLGPGGASSPFSALCLAPLHLGKIFHSHKVPYSWKWSWCHHPVLDFPSRFEPCKFFLGANSCPARGDPSSRAHSQGVLGWSPNAAHALRTLSSPHHPPGTSFLLRSLPGQLPSSLVEVAGTYFACKLREQKAPVCPVTSSHPGP